VALRDWIVKRLGGDDPVAVGDIVEVATVELWRSELAAAALRDAGIPCETAPAGGPPGRTDSAWPMARLYVPGERLADARRVLEDTTRTADG
jgi:hypothetical protein